MNNLMPDKCTRCGKPFTNLRMRVTLSLYTERMKESGVWEEIPNLNQSSTEVLCEKCFDDFCDVMNQMNVKHVEEPKVKVESNVTYDQSAKEGSKK